MKLYDATRAPNPRHVRVFLAEKGITVAMVHVDIAKGQHKSAEFWKKNGKFQFWNWTMAPASASSFF